MKQIQYTAEVLTPLFLGGAEARGKPELRSPSLRGALRYWYRALLGGCASIELSKDNLQQREEAVFGSTKVGSPVTIRLLGVNTIAVESYQKERALRTPDGDYQPTGRDYLLWSLAESGREGSPRHLPAREYLTPGVKFEITLQTRADEESLNQAHAALWLLASLGALGARANRAAGSLQLTATPGGGTPAFKVCPTLDELCQHLRGGLEECLKLVGEQSAGWRDFTGTPVEYDILSPSSAEIWIVADTQEGWPDSNAALNSLGSRLRDFRSRRNPIGRADHDAVLAWAEKSAKEPQIQRAAFGLPIPFQYSGGGPRDVIQATNDIDRRASPLKMRLTRLSSGRYCGVLVLFRSRFLPEGDKLQLQSLQSTAPPPADYAVIQNFIRTFPARMEVMP
jgi:CRISPR-associated protein Cmr1